MATAGIVVLMIAAASWGFAHLPDGRPIPVHFNAEGVVDGWGSPVMLFLLPGIAALNWALMWVLPRIDPRGENIIRSAKAYGIVWLAITVVLALIQGIMVSSALGVDVHRLTLFPMLIGGLLIVIGNVMGKMRWNSTVGIRTPWALADERVWDKTQRFGGRMMVASGIVVMIAALSPALQPHIDVVITASVLAVTLTIYCQSYLYWRSDSPSMRKH
jgi:uncharacterized membrane protein